jgi:predicted membrane channel-forming protein YqfA (hemolysin III family)
LTHAFQAALWRISAVSWALFILLTISFGRPFCTFLKANTPFDLLVYLGLALTGLIFLGILIFFLKIRHWRTWLVLAAALLVYGTAIWAFRFEDLENILHFIEFSLLYFLIYKAVPGAKKPWLLALLLSILVGEAIEITQIFIPGRYCDLLDVATNSIGGFFGIILTGIIEGDKKKISRTRD